MRVDSEDILLAICAVCLAVVLCVWSVSCDRTGQACIKAGGNFTHGDCRFSTKQKSEQE